jgi:aspartyl-tRNA(Asn)/glutamyl-tRNA(Gln) amidotransferase subunit B
MTQKYETIIGLEIHVQLDTKSKMFSRADNNSEEAEPNTNVLPLCLGYPGTLPVINEQAIEFGIIGSLALGCEINPMQRFDRKNYFYPDLPKGYQISQFFFPAGEHGKVKVDYLAPDRKTKKEFEVGITRLHLEEDAGKSIHTKDATLIDLNRCGTPLAEIVTEPDIKSPEEARAFLQELQRIVRAVGISKADMEKGHMRVDANVSVRPLGQKEFGTKVEVKNINSFKFVERALTFEVERQREMLERGEKIDQETRGWDEKTGTTVSQRGKEGDIDYRYFPEPDLPPIFVDKKEVAEIKENMAILPRTEREKAEQLGLSYNRVAELQDTNKLWLFLGVHQMKGALTETQLANWVDKFDTVDDLIDFIEKINKNDLSTSAAQKLFETGEIQISAGDDEVKTMIEEVLESEKETVERYRNGEEKLFGYLVGQVMAKTKGSAEPALVQQILKDLLTP